MTGQNQTLGAPLHVGELTDVADGLVRLARGIVKDTALAHDVVQGALAVGVERPPERLSAAWLRQVVRHRAFDTLKARRRDPVSIEAGGDEDGRHAYEAVIDDSALDPAKVTEQLELKRMLVDSVDALAEPYRSVVYMRFFEGRMPMEIARVRGVPVKTVKTQLTRALGKLRERMERDGCMPAIAAFGAVGRLGGGSAASEVRHFARASGSSLGALGLQLALVLAVPLLILCAAWKLAPVGDVVRAAADPVAGDPHALLERPQPADVRELQGGIGPGAVGRAPVPRGVALGGGNAVESANGELDEGPAAELGIHLKWSDGAPAVDVALRATAGGESFRSVTDKNGFTRLRGPFSRRDPDVLELRAERGDGELIRTIEVHRGTVQNVSLVLGRGVDVRGNVVDRDGNAMPGAFLWLASWGSGDRGGRVVGRADSVGEFHLRDVPPAGRIGAMGPCALTLELSGLPTRSVGGEPTAVRLVLDSVAPGIEGRVVGHDGRPLRDAALHVEVEGTKHWSHSIAMTGRDGRYSMPALVGESAVLRLVVDGGFELQRRVDLEPGELRVEDFQMPRPAVVRGRVIDTAGDPVPGAIVLSSHVEPDAAFAEGALAGTLGGRPRGTLVDLDGAYSLESLPPREIWLMAVAPARRDAPSETLSGNGSARFVTKRLGLVPGHTMDWSPILPETSELNR